jgi:hypothetical protein
MFTLSRFPIPNLLFSDSDPAAISHDKLKGLHRFGPIKRLKKPARFAFVFPDGRNRDANSLFLALRNGVGPFKGFPTVFRSAFDKTQVEAITGFKLRGGTDHSVHAKSYSDAVLSWLANHEKPDLVFLLHERTSNWEAQTPYHSCKRVLLRHGIVSQSVTFDLLRNPSQFEWSAANIALAVFCKLGGVPWVAAQTARRDHVVIGVGRAETQDPGSRTRQRRTAFTTCVTGRGEYQFSTVAKTVDTEAEYLAQLTLAVQSSIAKATSAHHRPGGITLHVTKNFSRKEMQAVAKGLEATTNIDVTVLKVTDEPHFFVVDTDNQYGLPQRGTCIRIAGRDALLYTEGRDDVRTWRDRLPTAIRIQDHSGGGQLATEGVREVLDLSQVNFRGFNARSAPAPLVYSHEVARLLEGSSGDDGKQQVVDDSLAETMWFL